LCFALLCAVAWCRLNPQIAGFVKQTDCNNNNNQVYNYVMPNGTCVTVIPEPIRDNSEGTWAGAKSVMTYCLGNTAADFAYETLYNDSNCGSVLVPTQPWQLRHCQFSLFRYDCLDADANIQSGGVFWKPSLVIVSTIFVLPLLLL